jgi:Delta7-sterol 5-desaturase
MSAPLIVAAALAGGLGMYFGLGGLLELRFYRRRAEAAAWKLQPGRWPSRRARRRELLLGLANVTFASIATGLFAAYVVLGGRSAVSFDLAELGLLVGLATPLVYFVGTDAALYGAHRLLHRRWLFRHIHRVHHRWTSPTAFTAMAMHPLELALYQAVMLLPLLVLPIHAVGVIAVLLYHNTIALLDHSGVALGSVVPWQPPPRFHDDHHVHVHVNYGQTLGVWDRLFGTWRRVGRVYGAEVFGGKGAPLGPERPDRPRYVDYRRPTAAPAPASLDPAR